MPSYAVNRSEEDRQKRIYREVEAEVITLQELMARWPSAKPDDLVRETVKGNFIAYTNALTRKTVRGICKNFYLEFCNLTKADVKDCNPEILFVLPDIIDFEAENPKLARAFRKKAPPSEKRPDGDITPKSKTSYLKLLAAFFKENKYNPEDHNTTNKVKILLQKAGFDLSEGTIRKIREEIKELNA